MIMGERVIPLVELGLQEKLHSNFSSPGLQLPKLSCPNESLIAELLQGNNHILSFPLHISSQETSQVSLKTRTKPSAASDKSRSATSVNVMHSAPRSMWISTWSKCLVKNLIDGAINMHMENVLCGLTGLESFDKFNGDWYCPQCE